MTERRWNKAGLAFLFIAVFAGILGELGQDVRLSFIICGFLCYGVALRKQRQRWDAEAVKLRLTGHEP